MMIGRSLYWRSATDNYVIALNNLTRWCLSLPGARLGIPLSDVATLVASVYASSEDNPPAEIQYLLSSLGADSQSAIPWPFDAIIWRQHLNKLQTWLVVTVQARAG